MNMYGPSMRKKEGMRQTDTKPLTRLITDEVEMINLHSTIWGTVQYGATHTVGFGKNAITHGRKRGGTALRVPWVLAKTRLPTVEKGAARRCAYRGFWQKRNYQR